MTSVNNCRDHGYEVEVIYDVMYPSGLNGTDFVTKVMKESYSINEAFKLSIRLQTVNVIEVDSSNMPGLPVRSVQMENDPDFLVDTPSSDPGLIGNIWINYQNLEKGLTDMLRVIRPGGKAVILEFSKPKKFPVKQLFGFYSKNIIPFFGRKISKDARAYTYLPESVAVFPEGMEFVTIMKNIGYRKVQSTLVSGGIATIYSGIK